MFAWGIPTACVYRAGQPYMVILFCSVLEEKEEGWALKSSPKLRMNLYGGSLQEEEGGLYCNSSSPMGYLFPLDTETLDMQGAAFL